MASSSTEQPQVQSTTVDERLVPTPPDFTARYHYTEIAKVHLAITLYHAHLGGFLNPYIQTFHKYMEFGDHKGDDCALTTIKKTTRTLARMLHPDRWEN